jgi:uncharacterized protein YdaU (DUF1376 family)
MRQTKHSFKPPAFQLYAKEFLQDEAVIAMDLEAVGAYIILLCHQWNEGSVPADVNLLARICRTTTERMKAIWPQIEVKFSPTLANKGRLVNPKLEIVRREKQKFAQKQATSGLRGAKQRWNPNPNPDKRVNGVADESVTGSAWASDSSGSGSGSGSGPAYAPPTPSGEGDGANAPLVLFPADPTGRTAAKQKPYADVLEQVARSIHERHPSAHGRRDLGVAAVEKKLAAILKHKRIPAAECEAYLRRIGRNHAAACQSEDWQKDGGQFVKSLRNYLAPTEERYDVEPAAAPQCTERRLMA